jgi:hypothetical protein
LLDLPPPGAAPDPALAPRRGRSPRDPRALTLRLTAWRAPRGHAELRTRRAH